MKRIDLDKLQWETLQRAEGDSLVIDFDARPRHIAIIPFEVLEDGLQTTNEEPFASAQQNRLEVEAAISKALEMDEWRELVSVGTNQSLFQLWINRSHFGK